MNVTSCICELLYTKRHAFLLSLLSDIYKITELILDPLLIGFVTSYCIKTLVGHELAGADSRLFQSIAVMA
jgi:hypothetical protein